MARQIEAFDQSEFIFERSGSAIPFPPLAFLGAGYYGDARVENAATGREVVYDLQSASQAAGLPLLLGERDALLLGEYVSWSRFRLQGEQSEDFEVTSIGFPMAWLRQVNDQWQAAAFVFPLGHDSSAPNAEWSWQYMGGVFARYVQSDSLWWAFGFYADVAPDEDFYIPYLGVTWNIGQHWALSAIMPWPALVYAPNDDWLFRLGASPSGASWSLAPGSEQDIAMNLDAWDLGLSVERRLAGRIYAGLEAGVGGFRGLRLDGSELEDSGISIHSSPYLKFEINFRPGDLSP